MTRIRSNLYNTVNCDAGLVCFMPAYPFGKLTGCGGQIFLLDKMETVFGKYVF